MIIILPFIRNITLLTISWQQHVIYISFTFTMYSYITFNWHANACIRIDVVDACSIVKTWGRCTFIYICNKILLSQSYTWDTSFFFYEYNVNVCNVNYVARKRIFLFKYIDYHFYLIFNLYGEISNLVILFELYIFYALKRGFIIIKNISQTKLRY